MINIYPAALVIPAHPSNYKRMEPKRGSFKIIVDHITSGRSNPYATAAGFATSGRGTSPHFIVGQAPEADEPVIQCVDLGDVAWHAHVANAESVGIEHCAREPHEPMFGKDDPGLAMTEPQWEKSARLHAWLLRVAGLELSRTVIVGHAEADPATTHTNCPHRAPGWSWDHLFDLISTELRRSDPMA